MLLLTAPPTAWRGVGSEQLRGEIRAMLDTSMHSVVAAEVEYLSAQLRQLPLMQQALEESEASGHTCSLDRCPTCGSSDGEDSPQGGRPQGRQAAHAQHGAGAGGDAPQDLAAAFAAQAV